MGVGHQVGLEPREIHIEGPIEVQGSSDGGHDQTNEPVEVGVGRMSDVQVAGRCHRWPHCPP